MTAFPSSLRTGCANSESRSPIQSLRHSRFQETKFLKKSQSLQNCRLKETKNKQLTRFYFSEKSQKSFIFFSIGITFTISSDLLKTHSVEMGLIGLQWIARHPRRKEGMEKAYSTSYTASQSHLGEEAGKAGREGTGDGNMRFYCCFSTKL